jgi:aminoglycoside phosphotransferase family enzyme/gluconate kinase
MRRPDFYPHRPASVILIQTHISYVFLAGSEVYKVKKPVRFSFLDFSTRERRRHFCSEEVRLNRRLAASIYRGVVGLREEGGGFRICPEDDRAAVDYAVRMTRLPEHRILTGLLEAAAVSAEMIDSLAVLLVRFHEKARCDEIVTANGAPERIRAIIEENFAAVRPYRNHTIDAGDDDEIQRFSREFLVREDALLRRRQREHRIREGHGDLHSEHICFTEPPVIFDCIEFNERFRHCDVASEVAFLAMDFDYHDHPDLARRFVQRYAEEAGDAELLWLLPFYQCYRAYVRGKVDSLTSAESEIESRDRDAAQSGARRHFRLAYRYTWAYSPSLVVFSGLSGTGKSTVAAVLHQRTGFVHLRSDVVRKQLAGIPQDPATRTGYARGIYTPEHSARTYEALLSAADQQLSARRGVVLDATFQRRADRDAARGLADRHQVPLLFVHCLCREDEVRQRLIRRSGDASDADWSVYVSQREHFEPFAEDEDAQRMELDTRQPPDHAAAEVLSVLRNRVAALNDRCG